MKKNKDAFSLIVAMGIVLISTLLAYTILEYIVPFSREVRGIEDSTKAYYYSNGGLEKGLYFFSTRKNEKIMEDISYTSPNYSRALSGTSFHTTSSGTILPAPGYGEAYEYNNLYEESKNNNIIAIGKPIQLSVGYGNIEYIDELSLGFTSPVLYAGDTWGSSDYQLKDGEYISWQLSNGENFLISSSGSLLDHSFINRTLDNSKIYNLSGIAYTDTGNEVQGITLGEFFETDTTDEIPGTGIYGAGCRDRYQKCILKFSIIRDLETTTAGLKLPYLKWKINLGRGDSMPLRYSIVESTGRAGTYARNLMLRYPQETVNQVLDFAVFQ